MLVSLLTTTSSTPGDPGGHERARTVLDRLSGLGLPVYEPFLFEVELRAILVRRIRPEQVLEITNMVRT